MERLPKIYPEGNKVLVRPDELEDKTEGGIIIPDIAKENESIYGTTGRLVRIGPATDLCVNTDGGEKVTLTNDMLPLRVFFPKYSGSEIIESPEGGKRVTYRLMLEQDIVAFLEEPKA